jgi:hypothetical protein
MKQLSLYIFYAVLFSSCNFFSHKDSCKLFNPEHWTDADMRTILPEDDEYITMYINRNPHRLKTDSDYNFLQKEGYLTTIENGGSHKIALTKKALQYKVRDDCVLTVNAYKFKAGKIQSFERKEIPESQQLPHHFQLTIKYEFFTITTPFARLQHLKEKVIIKKVVFVSNGCNWDLVEFGPAQY